MANRHFINEEGTAIICDCGVDISGASVIKLEIQKPSGTEVVKESGDGVAVYDSNYVKYIVEAGVLDETGLYRVQPYIEIGSWKGRGEKDEFRIYALMD